jgi:hypothetical protein
MIDQMGGWSTAGVGQSYGEGYGLQLLHGEISKMTRNPLYFNSTS